MATFEEKAERLKKELEEATNDDQRRNLSREYELTLRLLRIIRGEVFTLDDINKCRMEIMRLYPGYDRPITAESGILLAAEAIRKSFGKKYYLPLYKYPILYRLFIRFFSRRCRMSSSRNSTLFPNAV